MGTTNISLLITNMPAGKHFRVEGVSVREDFSFMVRPHCPVFALGQWVVQEGWASNEWFVSAEPFPYPLRSQC